jgi:hypothetical protein
MAAKFICIIGPQRNEVDGAESEMKPPLIARPSWTREEERLRSLIMAGKAITGDSRGTKALAISKANVLGIVVGLVKGKRGGHRPGA